MNSSDESEQDLSSVQGSESDGDESGDDGIMNEFGSGEGEDSNSDGSEDSEDEDGENISPSHQDASKESKVGKGQEKLSMEEVSKLKEAQSVQQSNLYRIQINELLSEVSIKSKHRSQIDTWVKEFKKWIPTVKSIDGIPIESLHELKRKLKIKQLPLPTRLHPAKGSNVGLFKWVAPKVIVPIGSWATNTAVFGISAYDVAIEIPKECFNKSDYLNHKYHIKRALYLSYLGRQLESRGDNVRLCCPDGNLLRPVLEINIGMNASEKPLQIYLHFIPPFDLFQAKRFDRDTNNVRYNYFFGAEQEDDEAVLSTPIYNQTILNDIYLIRNHDLAQKLLPSPSSSTNSICDAIKLMKIWLQQRHLNQGYGAFSNYIMAMFVCSLAQQGRISDTMSTYQIIRIVFVNLAKSEWLTKGICFGDSCENLASWFLQFDVVFLDSTGLINLTSCMSKYTYERVKHEAQLALDILNSSDVYGFQSMFTRDVSFSMNFDHILQIKVTPKFLNQFEGLQEHKPTILSTSGYLLPVGVTSIGQIIENGLKKRVHVIDFEIPKPPVWSLSDTTLPPVFTGFMTIQFGLTINRAKAFKLVEKCETETETDVESFKSFWGEKSQTRRFRDGTIVEAVSFEVEKQDNPNSHICFLMLQYLLKHHLDLHISDNEVVIEDGAPFGYYLNNQLENVVDPTFQMIRPVANNDESVVPLPKKKKRGKVQAEVTEIVPMTVDDITRQAISTLDELGRLLRDLEDLPLTITSIQGTSAILRHTNVCPNPPQVYYSSSLLTSRPSDSVHSLQIKESLQAEEKPKVPLYNEPIDVVVQLEGSGKWPDDIHAIRRLKCAFLVRIGQLLQSKSGLTVHVHPSKLHVIKDGFIFSIQLTYFRELILLKQLQGDDGILRYRDNFESLQREKSTLLLPKLSSILHSVHSQFTAFGKTCRLVKRWIASQMLLASSQCPLDAKQPDYCLTEEAAELIVASVFLNYPPYLEPPNEAQLGFMRFLNYLTTLDWKSSAVILNFNDSFTNEEMRSIESELMKRRSTLPTPFISYPDDRLNSVWTKNLLPIVWRRVVSLGKQAQQVLLTHFEQNYCTRLTEKQDVLVDPFKTIFKPDLSQFDILIWLRKGMNCKKRASLNEILKEDDTSRQIQQYKQYQKPSEELVPIVNFDPVQSYLVELRQNFGHFGLFLHDTYGGDVIAFVWKPDMLKEHEFKISSVKGQTLKQSPTTSPSLSPVVVPNIEGLVELFHLLGDGIVDRIETVRKSDEIKLEKMETETEP